jgi:hypothetical protein
MEQLFTKEQIGLLKELLKRNASAAHSVGDRETIDLSIDTLAGVMRAEGRYPVSLYK